MSNARSFRATSGRSSIPGALRIATAFLLLATLSGCGQAEGSAPADNAPSSSSRAVTEPRTTVPDGKPLVDAIRKDLAPHDVDEKAGFITAWSDLNGDGKDEALVYLVDPGTCGSGGCNLYVLTDGGDGSWAVESHMTITHPPIYRLPRGKDGWAELGVTVSGGGLARMVMAVPHGSSGYALNPTVPPARAVDPGNAEVLISQEALMASAGG